MLFVPGSSGTLHGALLHWHQQLSHSRALPLDTLSDADRQIAVAQSLHQLPRHAVVVAYSEGGARALHEIELIAAKHLRLVLVSPAYSTLDRGPVSIPHVVAHNTPILLIDTERGWNGIDPRYKSLARQQLRQHCQNKHSYAILPNSTHSLSTVSRAKTLRYLVAHWQGHLRALAGL